MVEENAPERGRDNTPAARPSSSLQTRIAVIAAGFMVLSSAALAAYIGIELRRAVEESVLHEALLFSDTLESTVIGLAAQSDFAAMQGYIDRLVSIRDANDIEINVLMFSGQTSAIVASNDPLNIEQTSEEEHLALLESLAFDRPVIDIDREDEDIDPDDDPSKRFDPAHPDYYFRPGVRFLSITTPLVADGRRLGSLNTKLSLSFLDERLGAIFR